MSQPHLPVMNGNNPQMRDGPRYSTRRCGKGPGEPQTSWKWLYLSSKAPWAHPDPANSLLNCWWQIRILPPSRKVTLQPSHSRCSAWIPMDNTGHKTNTRTLWDYFFLLRNMKAKRSIVCYCPIPCGCVGPFLLVFLFLVLIIMRSMWGFIGDNTSSQLMAKYKPQLSERSWANSCLQSMSPQEFFNKASILGTMTKGDTKITQ